MNKHENTRFLSQWKHCNCELVLFQHWQDTDLLTFETETQRVPLCQLINPRLTQNWEAKIIISWSKLCKNWRSVYCYNILI